MRKSIDELAYSADYYRMTGEEFKGTLKNYIQIFLHHNLKYMYWWRKKDKFIVGKIARVLLYRYSRKYGLELGEAQIGKGIYLGHPYNITINGEAIIGENVNIHKGVTIGKENRGKRVGAPTICNKVFVGINATIVGNITIGEDVMIAPNSFVNFDVPSHSIVIGNPAIIHHKENATENYIGFCV